MKLVIFLALLGVALAVPVEIERSENDPPDTEGNYRFSFLTEDGISRQEEGGLTDPDTLSVAGEYSYTSPEGISVRIVYVANENGYQPTIVIGGGPLQILPPLDPVLRVEAAAVPAGLGVGK